ncbi:hypothetical protein GCM10010510_14610 [Streptomyces anandii JCM 4720]|nr:hypothetical protein GCM10010510_14610 [Streptomyces anandii JCM 4720]
MASRSAEASASGTPGPERQLISTRRAAVGTGVFEPFGIDMFAPITCRPGRVPAVARLAARPNLFPWSP